MSAPPLTIAVVGHTNTGKTSLLRTLLRDVNFGDVADRPAVTRVVEAAVLQASGQPLVEFVDTPGLEDSIGLLEILDEQRERSSDAHDALRSFLEQHGDHGPFTQEVAGLRQVLASSAALYVIDARERVLSRHRDELEILARCARPIIPVLNFVAADDARTDEWRDTLRRLNLHAVASFDTVVFDARDEERLYEKIRTLLDAKQMNTLIEERRSQRLHLYRSSALLLAELLVDVAAFAERFDGPTPTPELAERFRAGIRTREHETVEQLLVLHRFRPNDVLPTDVAIEDGAFAIDLFSRAALKQFGLTAGGAAAAGAMVGLSLDVMVGGLSGGAATLLGATIGGLMGTARSHGRRMIDRVRGRTELRCEERTIELLALRGISLVNALLVRGHATMDAIDRLALPTPDPVPLRKKIAPHIAEARAHSDWSHLRRLPIATATDPGTRQIMVTRLAETLQGEFIGVAGKINPNHV